MREGRQDTGIDTDTSRAVACELKFTKSGSINYLQPRYLLTSLALNDLAIGLLVTPFGVVSALFHCWAFGEVACQIQVSS